MNEKNYPKIFLDGDIIPYISISLGNPQLGDNGIDFGCELVSTKAYIKVGDVLKYSHRGYKSKFFKVTNINTQPYKFFLLDKKYVENFKYVYISGEWV